MLYDMGANDGCRCDDQNDGCRCDDQNAIELSTPNPDFKYLFAISYLVFWSFQLSGTARHHTQQTHAHVKYSYIFFTLLHVFLHLYAFTPVQLQLSISGTVGHRAQYSAKTEATADAREYGCIK